MEIKNKIHDLLVNQKNILKEYEDLVEELNIDHGINENIELRKEINNYKKSLGEIKKRQAQLIGDNMGLKASLKEQMINEKIGILNGSKRKMDIYFKDETNKNINKLKTLEKSAKDKVKKLEIIAKKELGKEKEEIFSQIDMMKKEIERKIAIRKEKIEKEKDSLFEEIKREYDELKNEGVSHEVLEKKKKYNDIEVKIGINWINKAGIILVLLGVATGMKYTYSTWFNEYMKAISGFLLGAVLLGVGEWFNKKDKNLFALGLSGGGIGVLYLAVFSSYFILNILTMPVSIFLSILVTMVSLVLSKRYTSRTICGISLVGGYLPFFTYVFTQGISGTSVYIVMGYLFILNLLVLGLSLERRWVYINYLSFLLNIPCLIYLAFKSPSKIISICYGVMIFIMYLAITLVYPIREKIKLKKVDVALLGLNTVINCFLVYALFQVGGYYSYKGLLALIYGLIYLGLGQFIRKSASQEKSIEGLFYITAMTFSILMIPFQFGVGWASLGWLIEGILMIHYANKYYGNKRDAEKMEFAGWIILGLCVLGFIIIDFMQMAITKYFTLRYTLISLGLIYVLSLYVGKLNKSELFKYTRKGKLLTYYKYFTIMNTWIYFMRITWVIYDEYIQVYENFYFLISIALVTGLFAHFISRIKVIQDEVVNKIYIGFYILVDLLGFTMNFYKIGYGVGNSNYRVIGIVILILYNIFVLLSIKDLTWRFIKKRGISVEFYPMSMAIYILGATIILITNQFNLDNISLIISIFLLTMSFLYVIYGFKKNFMILRRFGLALSIFSTGKLFIFDLAFLNTTGKIVAYFSFGVVLIGISYIYHKLKNSMGGLKEE
ncbi:MAG: DUF2339 domain-containing protein [Anaeromicrobium sp.]|uniref:DUF2339 domain-containing protein n=1 Tax=Anaeromicrobium sp. TaxID=1929132 RepID=UPI0025FF540E|nr:DUF2339 domain-containing protein [Anaeromicrobium sp.]MCT4595691.1 DUF2339 domain-containing protein [Anaeromicrobium sp.]